MSLILPSSFTSERITPVDSPSNHYLKVSRTDFTEGEDNLAVMMIGRHIDVTVNGKSVIDPERQKRENSARVALVDMIVNSAIGKGIDAFELLR